MQKIGYFNAIFEAWKWSDNLLETQFHSWENFTYFHKYQKKG